MIDTNKEIISVLCVECGKFVDESLSMPAHKDIEGETITVATCFTCNAEAERDVIRKRAEARTEAGRRYRDMNGMDDE